MQTEQNNEASGEEESSETGRGVSCPTPCGAGASCSDSKTSAAVLKNIGQSKLIFGENIADVLLTFGKNVLRLE